VSSAVCSIMTMPGVVRAIPEARAASKTTQRTGTGCDVLRSGGSPTRHRTVEGIRVGRLDATNRRCAVSSAARASAALDRSCGCLRNGVRGGAYGVHVFHTKAR
jgi:hypothetical protein